MDLKQDHLYVAFAAWAAAQKGGGITVGANHLHAAHDLAEEGWLERRFVTGDLSWWWTTAADTALALDALTDVSDRQN
jgi:hypothetical protein